jgi:hypothetical protein
MPLIIFSFSWGRGQVLRPDCFRLGCYLGSLGCPPATNKPPRSQASSADF